MTDVDGLSLSVKHSSTKKGKALVRSPFPRNGIEIYLERIKKLTCFNNIVYFPVLRLGILSFLGCTVLKRTKSQKTVMLSRTCLLLGIYHNVTAMPQSQRYRYREIQKMGCCAQSPSWDSKRKEVEAKI